MDNNVYVSYLAERRRETWEESAKGGVLWERDVLLARNILVCAIKKYYKEKFPRDGRDGVEICRAQEARQEDVESAISRAKAQKAFAGDWTKMYAANERRVGPHGRGKR